MGINKISTKVMSYAQWLEARKNGIGGSDSAAIVGMNEYASPYTVWCDKTGRTAPKEDNEAMRQGRDLEEYVAERFCEATGKKVRRSNFMYQNDLYPWAQANVDRLIVGENAGLECKTTSVMCLKKFKNGEYPDRYYTQCMHYMAVTGCEKWYLAVVVLGSEFKLFEIVRDEDEIKALMDAEKLFWEEYVQKDMAPPHSGINAEGEILKNLYPSDNGEEAYMPQLNALLESYREMKGYEEHYEKQKEAVAQEIKEQMGDIAKAMTDMGNITWKTQVRKVFDSKRLLEERPDEDFGAYFKDSVSRVFRVGK